MSEIGKGIVDLSELRKAWDIIDRIDAIPLSQVEIRDNDAPVAVTDAEREEWRFMGFSTSGILKYRFLDSEVDEDE